MKTIIEAGKTVLVLITGTGQRACGCCKAELDTLDGQPCPFCGALIDIDNASVMSPEAFIRMAASIPLPR